jgi:hypothetical protein
MKIEVTEGAAILPNGRGTFSEIPPTAWHSMKVEKPVPGREIYFVYGVPVYGIFKTHAGHRRSYTFCPDAENLIKDQDIGCDVDMNDILAWRYVRPEFTADDLAQIRMMEKEHDPTESR